MPIMNFLFVSKFMLKVFKYLTHFFFDGIFWTCSLCKSLLDSSDLAAMRSRLANAQSISLNVLINFTGRFNSLREYLYNVENFLLISKVFSIFSFRRIKTASCMNQQIVFDDFRLHCRLRFQSK